MKIRFRLWSLGLGLLAAGPVVGAEPLPWPDETAPAESVLQKSTRLIREKAGLPVAPAIPVPVPPATGNREGMLQLDPIIVHGQLPALIPPAVHETPTARFFRTGTIWQGKKFKFWIAGDKGLMLTFLW